MEKGIYITIGIIIIVSAAIVAVIYFTGGFGGANSPTTDLNTKGIILF